MKAMQMPPLIREEKGMAHKDHAHAHHHTRTTNTLHNETNTWPDDEKNGSTLGRRQPITPTDRTKPCYQITRQGPDA